MGFTAEQYLGKLTQLVSEFEQVLREADLSAPVPNCGSWTLHDLGAHLGHVHRWAAKVVRTGEVNKDKHTPEGEPIADWYAQTAAELLDALGAADPEAPGWSFGPEKKRGFWFRRQVQETMMHLWDARNAVGGPARIDPELAADGVDEVLRTFLPKITRWHEPPKLAAPLLVRATDTGDSWLLRPAEVEGESPTAEHGAAPEGVTTVSASAEDLLMLLWKRRSTEDVRPEVVGEPGVVADFLRAPLTP